MEGVRGTFDQLLADLQKRLSQAEFVAIDTELTGINIEGEQDTFEEPPSVRLDRLCRVAETYCLIQLGITVVSQVSNGAASSTTHCSCMSYNLFAFPHWGPELLGRSPNFECQPTALKFNAQHHLDFNRWIYDGVPYMTRDDERRYLSTSAGREDPELDQKTGLLRLWKVLCSSGLPFVVHCPSDLFFLLAAFECNPLPRDPRQIARLIRRCTPKVFDTAHLHSLIGRFRRLGLINFFEDAKARYEKSLKDGSGAVPVEFTLEGETSQYGNPKAGEKAHQAGYDSLVTAKLFMYLRSLAPMKVSEGANHLFLYHSVEYIDLDRALQTGELGCSLFDHSRVTLLVASVRPDDAQAVARRMAAAEYLCKIMDIVHVLVVLRASGGAAVRKAVDLATAVPEVLEWMAFDEWRSRQAAGRPTGRSNVVSSRAKLNPEGSASAAVPVPSASSSSTASAAAVATSQQSVFVTDSVGADDPLHAVSSACLTDVAGSPSSDSSNCNGNHNHHRSDHFRFIENGLGRPIVTLSVMASAVLMALL
eukprot:CAMPEP_0178421994 /NCGR_PEP_ID=MMETSP0689_2-20121128/26941_1 /TAXON_ID=160604 /ORGANISM="Amphidinium massartii, Strain CS-259" /LENGTH=534 /DNA_ID=CAMNT_0020043537 /DNA_START=35 /DNA_END=1635 /DNA_ORIENTATION=+